MQKAPKKYINFIPKYSHFSIKNNYPVIDSIKSNKIESLIGFVLQFTSTIGLTLINGPTARNKL